MLEALSASEDYGIILRAKGMLPAEDGTWIYFDMVPRKQKSVKVHRNTQAVSA